MDEAPTEEGDTNERLQGLLADDRAVGRARDGRDGYWRDLARNMERRWQVDKDHVRTGPKLGLGFSVDQWVETWRARARTYVATGNPYGDGAFARGSPQLTDSARPLQLDENLVRLDYEGGTNGTYNLMRVALVLVIQDDEGRVAEVRLHRSSGSRGYDEGALKAAQTLASDDLGVPPQGRQSLWAFYAALAVTPPAPIVGCGFDAYFIPTECFYPLSEHLRSRVRLVGIWARGEKPGLK